MIISDFVITPIDNRKKFKILGGKNHTYHSDFYLSEYNLICEIESNYIYNMEIPINGLGREYSIINEYEFLFIVDKNYTDFEKIISIQ